LNCFNATDKVQQLHCIPLVFLLLQQMPVRFVDFVLLL
jgi:hypothetical protein